MFQALIIESYQNHYFRYKIKKVHSLKIWGPEILPSANISCLNKNMENTSYCSLLKIFHSSIYRTKSCSKNEIHPSLCEQTNEAKFKATLSDSFLLSIVIDDRDKSRTNILNFFKKKS